MEDQPAAPSQANLSPRPDRSRPTAHAEIDLKLLASPAAIEQIRKAPVIVKNARNRGVVRRLETVYYDTPDQALARQRVSLRVRRNGRRYVQTLKLARADRPPFARQQWDMPVATPAPDLSGACPRRSTPRSRSPRMSSPRYSPPGSAVMRSG